MSTGTPVVIDRADSSSGVAVVPRVGVVALARSTFDLAHAEAVVARAWTTLDQAAVELVGTADLVLDGEQLELRCDQLARSEVDLILVIQATFTDADGIKELARRIDRPLVAWSVPEERTGGRLRLNSFCGVNLASHSLSRVGVTLHHVHGAETSIAAADQIVVYARAARVRRLLSESRLLLVGEHPDGFDACFVDDQALSDRFGVAVERTPVDEFIGGVRALPDCLVDRPLARRQQDFANLDELDQEATTRTLKVYAALRARADAEGFAGVALRCWPDFFTDYNCAACGALALLNEDRTPGGCEADVMGVVTSLALQEASGQPVFNTDLVDVDPDSDTVVFWHCGQAPIDMADREQEIRGTVHGNRGLPLLGEFALKPGRVTVARFSQGKGTMRLVLGGADMVSAPRPFSGTAGTARPDGSAESFMRRLIGEGVEHHTTLAYGEHRPVMRALAAQLGIEVVELTEEGDRRS